MKLIKLFSSKYNEEFKINKGLEILGFNEDLALETKSFIMSEITNYLFKQSKSLNEDKKTFDLELDYKYYYCDFKEIGNGIDLNKDNISWWEFDTLLEGIFLKKDSVIGQVIDYRLYKKPSKNIKVSEQEEHRFYLAKQRQYALEQPKEKTDWNMQKLWNYIEKKAGDGNE